MSKCKRFWRYYIKGDYHCDTCPFCWGVEYLPGCDDYADAGCCIKGELRDTCRLLPPIRFLLGWGRRKKALYYRAHEHDGFAEFVEERERQNREVEKALHNYLNTHGYSIVYASQGKAVFLNDDHETLKEYCEIYRLTSDLQDIFAPVKYVPLKSRWKELIKDTWNRFLMIFKPYFCK